MKKKTKEQLLQTLSKLYPKPASELNFKNNFQLLVSVVLSAQCTDKKVNDVTPHLFNQYPNFKALASAKLTDIEKIIRPINYYKTKSKNLINLSKMVEAEFSGKIPKQFEEILKLPGVGRKTANVVLGELGVIHTLPVDTHVFRVSKRLGLASGKNTDQVEEELKAQFDSSLWRNLHHWLILHGRRVCKAQNPVCSDCDIREICPSREE
ncbi:MAG: endonuclease III [Deltaproteobacteria bacterium]|nr:endonuclease III [Deltaproteobacteria bacterium]